MHLAFQIVFDDEAAAELEAFRAYDQKRIIDAVRDQLTHEPQVPTRNRKCLRGLEPEFQHIGPVWELRVGLFRVFFDVLEESNEVRVRAVRRKQTTDRTKDIT
jgi:mRNA-degrading endonuclease RelE of RelBE toxin-antitoxin system